MGVETGMARGAEQMGGTDASLPQHQLQMRLGALRTGFAHAATDSQVNSRIVIVEMVDNGLRVKFSKNKAIFIAMMAAAGHRARSACLAGRCFKG